MAKIYLSQPSQIRTIKFIFTASEIINLDTVPITFFSYVDNTNFYRFALIGFTLKMPVTRRIDNIDSIYIQSDSNTKVCAYLEPQIDQLGYGYTYNFLLNGAGGSEFARANESFTIAATNNGSAIFTTGTGDIEIYLFYINF